MLRLPLVTVSPCSATKLSAFSASAGGAVLNMEDSSSSSSSSNRNEEDNNNKNEQPNQTVAEGANVNSPQNNSSHSSTTLYDVLGVSPTATREEMKRRYAVLAREFHPDALISSQLTNHDNLDAAAFELKRKVAEERFAEIAAAWKILSNRKERMRYDRSLQAAAIAQDISAFVSTVGQQAGPPARRIFEQLAVPFLRRTTATTVASFTAVSNNFKNGTNIGNAVVSAIQAGQRASKAVDSIELAEKAEELKRRANEEIEKAMKAKAELMETIDQRLYLTLRTPNSELTSTDALKIFDSLNTVDTLSLMDRAMWKQTLEQGILELQDVEAEYESKWEAQEQNEVRYGELRVQLQRDEENARRALEAEDRARKALEAAQRLVMETKQNLANTTKMYSQAEVTARKSFAELDKISLTLARRQEKVRKALRKKEEAVREKQRLAQLQASSPESNTAEYNQEEIYVGSWQRLVCDGEDEEVCLADIEECRLREKKLAEEAARLEDMATRFQLRAQKLIARARELEMQQFPKATTTTTTTTSTTINGGKSNNNNKATPR